MGKYLWLALLTAVAGCQPASPPVEETPRAAMAPASSTASAGQAATMRLHEALITRSDSLLREANRLRQLAVRLDTHRVAGRQRAVRLRRLAAALGAADAGGRQWLHDFHEIDTVGLSAHQYDDLWAFEQRALRRLTAQARTALDSARRVR